jgi:hypothetical protein
MMQVHDTHSSPNLRFLTPIIMLRNNYDDTRQDTRDDTQCNGNTQFMVIHMVVQN